MVAKPETLNRFIFNSDYPIDKIVWLYEGSATSPASSSTTGFIDINMEQILGNKKPIFIKGIFTVDNWQTSYMMGVNKVTTDPYKNVTMSLDWYEWDGKQLHINVGSRTSYSVNLPIKYRLWGVQREDIAMAVDYSKTTNISKTKLSFDASRNYPRLYKDGIARSGDVIEHNLNKIPYVDFWYTYGRNSSSFNSSWSYAPWGVLSNSTLHNTPTIMATDKAVTFCTVNGEDENYKFWYYYRIYA